MGADVPSQPIHIVIAGGNYAGLNALRHLYAGLLADGAPDLKTPEHPIRISLIDRRDGFLHTMGMTRGITETDFAQQLWLPYQQVPWLKHPQIQIIQAVIKQITPTTVILVDPQHPSILKSIQFDYLVIALGLSRFAPIGVNAPTQETFIEHLKAVHHDISASRSVAVVGGGPVGIEMAADIKCYFPHIHVTLVHSRPRLIPGPFSDQFRDQVAEILQSRIGVELILGDRVVDQYPPSADMAVPSEAIAAETPLEAISASGRNANLTLLSGRTISADWVVRCLGSRHQYDIINLPPRQGVNWDKDPSTDHETQTGTDAWPQSNPSVGTWDRSSPSIYGPNGIRVKATMQVDDARYPTIFAVGDICDRYEMKLAGVAMYGGYIAARNIIRMIWSGRGASRTVKKSTKGKEGKKGQVVASVPKRECSGKCNPAGADWSTEISETDESDASADSTDTESAAEANEPQLEISKNFPSKLLLLMGRHYYAFQLGEEIWNDQQTKQFVENDMGLQKCCEALCLQRVPKYEPVVESQSGE